jgi:hypothetical protein
MLKNLKSKLVVVIAAVVAAPAFAAVDPAVTTAVSTAYTDGGTLVSLAIAGLITLVAIMVGVGILISMMKRS